MRSRRVLAVAVVVGSACGALELSSTQQATIVLSNGSPLFGPVPIGMSKMTQFTFTPQVQGSDDDVVTATMKTTGDCNPYMLMLPPLPVRVFYGSDATACLAPPPGAGGGSVFGTVCPYQFSVTFAPTVVGESQCDVDITYHQTAQPSVVSVYTLHLDGFGAQEAGISVIPSSIAFGTVRVASTSNVPLIVKNTGTMSLTVTGSTTDPTHVWFSTVPAIPGASFGLAAGSGSNFTVSCKPPLAGSMTGTLNFHGVTSTLAGSDGSAGLSCTGINSFLDIAPIPINFATTVVGSPPAPKSVTITNTGVTGTLSVTLDAMALANGVTLTQDPSGTLNGGAMAQATVAWSAPAANVGSLGTLVVHISTDGAGNNFNVGINGEADRATLGTLPGALDFGPVCTNTTSTADLKLYAVDPGDFMVTGVTVTPALFTVGPLSGPLKGNHVNELATTVMATPTTDGDFTGTLSVATDIPNMNTKTIDMKGTGVPGGVAATPDLVHFGAVMAGLVSSEQKVVLTNCGGSDLVVASAEFSGASPDEFKVLSPTTFPLTVPKARTATFNVAMTPLTTGPKSATLTITSDAGTTSALFDGMGVGSEFKRRETYYGCSASNGTAAWPIGLAVLALRRRRRRALS